MKSMLVLMERCPVRYRTKRWVFSTERGGVYARGGVCKGVGVVRGSLSCVRGEGGGERRWEMRGGGFVLRRRELFWRPVERCGLIGAWADARKRAAWGGRPGGARRKKSLASTRLRACGMQEQVGEGIGTRLSLGAGV